MRTSALVAAAALSSSGCFTGTFLAGQACMVDADCGPNLRCEAGRCGGASGSASEATTLPATSGEPTSVTGEPTSTTGEVSTSSSSGGPGTSTTSTGEATTMAVVSTGEETTSTTGPSCGVGRCGAFDVLVVVDNSPSMASKLEVVYTLFFAVVEAVFPMLLEACSVQIGVVSTDELAKNPDECRKLGALVHDDNGEPCPFVEGKPYATLADVVDPDPKHFSCMFSVTTQGSPDERIFDSIYRSLGAARNTGCNQGFHRPGAFLMLLVLTDGDDGDSKDPQGHAGSTDVPVNLWFNTLKVLKSGGEKNLYIGAVMGDEDQETTLCPWQPLAGQDGTGASPAPFLRSFIQQFPEQNRTIGSICNPKPQVSDYLPMMEELASEVRGLCEAG